MANYITSVGMEVHAELQTQSKMFCRCAVAFGGEPNTRVCPVCLGLPGTLPVPNRRAVEMVLKTALALNCKVAMHSLFHRKNYFYPDLPKAFQVSQYGEENPIGFHGFLEIPHPELGTKRIAIRRVHLEEDTGKLLHLPSGGSGVDFNRAGVPLMEIVSGFPPDIHTPDESREYLMQLRMILIYLGVCDGKMEEGSMRCEPNISVRPDSTETLGTKTELKNLNSFRSVQLGVAFETRRQVAVLEGGGKVLQETRGWNDGNETSYAMRLKESENDYRYFECPDLVPIEFSEEYVESIRASLPELPLAKSQRYQSEFGLTAKEAGVLIADRHWAGFFESGVAEGGNAKLLSNWMNSDFARLLNETGQVVHGDLVDGQHAISKISAGHLVELIDLIQRGEINGKTAKAMFDEMFTTGSRASELLAKSNLSQISNTEEIAQWCREAIGENPEPVQKYKNGQTNTIGFLVGQVMRKSQGRANAAMVQEIMRTELDA